MITTVGVVVPAHNEEDLLPGCLAALHEAAARLDRIPVHLLVVADSCTDRTAEVARRGGAAVIEIEVRRVGSARAAGIAAVLRAAPGPDPAAIWLATTDADSRVPPGWLARQVALAGQGWDAVAGTITVSDWSGHPAHVPGAFAARYAHAGPGHPHVHGANLGFTAAAYLAAGGFQQRITAEDHALVQALVQAGRNVLRATDLPVVTSARRRARAPRGFGQLLASMA